MNQINAITIGKLIAAHREGDEEKFKAYVDFIAEAYEQQGNDRAAHIIRSNYTGDYGEQGKVVLDEVGEQTIRWLNLAVFVTARKQSATIIGKSIKRKF